ncbi:MAG: hypothetical protein IJZ46_00100 [Bacilli bacterium]|nr:hypothetical protein [Bacilli bacterium]
MLKLIQNQKKEKLFSDLFCISNNCHYILDIKEYFDWEYDDSYFELSEYYNFLFIENLLKYKDSFLKISNSVINSYISSDFPLNNYYFDYYTSFNKLKKEDMLEIMYSFLNDLDYDLLKKFKQKISEGDFVVSNFKGDYSYLCGLSSDLNSLKKTLVYINSNYYDKNTIDVAAIMMHEYGHCFERSLYHENGIKNNMNLYPFSEVSSEFFEFSFINYLLENNIYVNDVKKWIRKRYSRLFHEILGINLLSQVKISLDNKELIYDINYLNTKKKKIEEKVNYYGYGNLEINNETLSNSYLYGIGILFSIYLYDNYKNNPKNFMKEFKNILFTYQSINNINAFERVGITEEKLIDGSILKRYLKNSR